MNDKIREIIVLSKIRRNENYYIVGIDLTSNSIVRLITNKKEIGYAIKPKDFVNKIGDEANILDKVVVQIKNKSLCKYNHHTENLVIDTDYYIYNKGRCTSEELQSILEKCSNKSEYVLFNKDKRILEDKLLNLEKRHSLELVCIEEFDIKIRDFEEGILVGDILFNGIWYKNLEIKDKVFREKYYMQILDSTKGYITLQNIYLLMGFSKCTYGHYYKVIEKVIDIENL